MSVFKQNILWKFCHDSMSPTLMILCYNTLSRFSSRRSLFLKMILNLIDGIVNNAIFSAFILFFWERKHLF